MKTLSFFFTVSFLFFVGQGIRAEKYSSVAVVLKVRGKVTQLHATERIARKVKVGDKIKEDTSLLTYQDSFLQIKFNEKSVLNVGPESKIVMVKIDEEKNIITDLLKGVVRGRIKREGYERNKFFMRTRNVVSGLDEADFQMIYNPENQLTGLLAYEGQVSMVSYEKGQENLLRPRRKVVRDDQGKIKLERERIDIVADQKKLSLILQEKKGVLVRSGQYSHTLQAWNALSFPVKVNPVQLNILYKNVEFQRKKDGEIRPANLGDKSKRVLEGISSEIPPEGIYHTAQGRYAPKAGGLIDEKTGLYIPPSQDALFDQQEQIYRALKNGRVDADTGQYFPPQGLKLDPRQGFIPLASTSSQDKQKAQQFNKTLGRELLVRKGNLQGRSSFRSLTHRELITKNNFSISFLPYWQTLKVNNDSQTGGSKSYKLNPSSRVEISWAHSSGGRWRPITSFSLSTFNLSEEERAGAGQEGKKAFGLAAGLKYSLSHRLELWSQVNVQQNYYFSYPVLLEPEKRFIPMTIFQLQLGLEALLLKRKRYDVNFILGLGSNLKRNSDILRIDPGLSFLSSLEGRFWLNRSLWLSFKGSLTEESQKVANSNFNAKANRSTRLAGMGLGFVF